MTMPKFNELYSNVLSLFSDQYVEYKTRFIKKTVADQLNLTFEERNELKSSGDEPLIENRVGWTISYLKQANLLESKKIGYVNITEEGLRLYKENPNITEKDLLEYPPFAEVIREKNIKKHKSRAEKSLMSFSVENKNILEDLINQINQKLANLLLEKITKSNFKLFKKTIQDLLLNMNFSEFTFELNDDSNELIGIVNKDKFGLEKVAITAFKSDNVNLQDLQNFAGFMVSHGLKNGVVISIVSFDNQIIEYINNQVNLNIILIDGKKLSELMIQYNVGTYTSLIYEIKNIDNDYFNNL